jgi:hypothetical protein
VPKCLVIAPSYAELSPLRAVLGELETEVTTTAQLLVGAQLASVPLDQFDFAVAVLPATGPNGRPSTTPAAIYVEAGIVLGRGLPLIVLAEDAREDLPSLGGLASNVWLVAGARDEDNIRLHLSLFTKVLANSQPVAVVAGADPSVLPTKAWTGDTTNRGQRLFEAVVGLFEAGGAVVEEANDGPGDRGVDAAVLIPGTQRSLGPVLLQVKAFQGRGLPQTIRQHAYPVRERGAMLGLVVYDGPRQDEHVPAGLPVVVMHVDDLRQSIESGDLGRRLIYARNTFVHGANRDA